VGNVDCWQLEASLGRLRHKLVAFAPWKRYSRCATHNLARDGAKRVASAGETTAATLGSMRIVRPLRWFYVVWFAGVAALGWLKLYDEPRPVIALIAFVVVGAVVGLAYVLWISAHDLRFARLAARNRNAVVVQGYENPELTTRLRWMKWIDEDEKLGQFVSVVFDTNGVSFWNKRIPRRLGLVPWADVRGISVGEPYDGEGKAKSFATLKIAVTVNGSDRDLVFGLEPKLSMPALNHYATRAAIESVVDVALRARAGVKFH